MKSDKKRKKRRGGNPFRFIPVLLILIAIVAVLYLVQYGPGIKIPNPFLKKEITTSSTAVFKQVKDISRLNTIEFIYKTVFPHDLVDPNTDWESVAGKLKSGKKLSYDEIEKISIFAIAAEAGIDLQKDKYDFAVISARITAGFDLSGNAFENAIKINEDDNSVIVKLPPVVITDIIIEDADSSNYNYPDLKVSPEQWKTLTKILSRKLKSEAVERNILTLARERGQVYIEQLLLNSGYSQVIFR